MRAEWGSLILVGVVATGFLITTTLFIGFREKNKNEVAEDVERWVVWDWDYDSEPPLPIFNSRDDDECQAVVYEL